MQFKLKHPNPKPQNPKTLNPKTLNPKTLSPKPAVASHQLPLLGFPTVWTWEITGRELGFVKGLCVAGIETLEGGGNQCIHEV